MGRRIAERLLDQEDSNLDEAGLMPDVVETAGLIHDMGHPPFGHAAEEALASALEDCGGFEGNAQSFRIVTKLSTRDFNSPGLDLTKATLGAVLKYPQLTPPNTPPDLTDRSKGKKWGAYETELEDFQFALGSVPAKGVAGVRTPNAIVMDWADDISFATHDLEDFIHAGIVQLETLASQWDEFCIDGKGRLAGKNGFNPDEYDRACQRVRSLFEGFKPYDGTRQHRAKLHSLISDLITDLDHACSEVDGPPYVEVNPHRQYVAEVLKHITNYYVVSNPSIRAAEAGQKKTVMRLHEELVESLTDRLAKQRSGCPDLLDEMFRAAAKEQDELEALRRAAADYICTLTEQQAVDLLGRISGQTPADSLGVWLR